MSAPPQSPKKKRAAGLRVALGVGVTAVALWLTLRSVDVGAVVHAAASADAAWLVLALATFVAMLAVRALRWSVLLGGTPFWTTLHANNIGYLMNGLLPLRAGELGRAFVVSDRAGVGIVRALSSVVVERGVDLGSVVLLCAAFARLVPMPPALERAATLGTVAVVAAVVAGAGFLWQAGRVEAFVRPRLARRGLRADAAWGRLHELRDGLRSTGSRAGLGAVAGLTAVIWAMTILGAYLAMRAFLPPSGVAAGVVVVASNLGGALPSAPGGLGVVQAFAKMALVAPFHLPEDRALAFVFVWSLGSQVTAIALGLVGLWRLGMSLGQARRGVEGEG